jgi:hypothetical protein
MGIGFHNYHSEHGEFPPDLAAIGFDEVFDGYVYDYRLTRSGFSVKAMPAAPGKTGTVWFELDQTGRILEAPVPGAKEIEKQMIENIWAYGMAAIMDLMEWDSVKAASDESKALMESQLVRELAWMKIDADGDNKVFLREIRDLEGEDSPAALNKLVREIWAELELGVGKENTDDVWVDSTIITGK